MSQNINDNFKINAGKAVDAKYGKTIAGKTVPYASTAEANAAINIAYRYEGLTVAIEGMGPIEYWYIGDLSDENLVVKSAAGSVSGANGLTVDSNNVILGGTLDRDTVINGAGYVLQIYNPDGGVFALGGNTIASTLGFVQDGGQTLLNVKDNHFDIEFPSYTDGKKAILITPEIVNIGGLNNADTSKFLQADASGNITNVSVPVMPNLGDTPGILPYKLGDTVVSQQFFGFATELTGPLLQPIGTVGTSKIVINMNAVFIDTSNNTRVCTPDMVDVYVEGSTGDIYADIKAAYIDAHGTSIFVYGTAQFLTPG